MNVFALTLFALLVNTAYGTTLNLQRNEDHLLYRLVNTTIPVHYQLTFTPYFYPDFYLDGEAILHIVPTQSNVQEIVLQIIDLNITSVEVTLNNQNVPLRVGNEISFNETYDFMYINLQNDLNYPLNNDEYYVVRIVYRALVREEMFGFYRSWYMTDGELKWMGSTHFQPTHPRKAFPCYDEPQFKATFDIIIRRLPHYRSWSNMRLANSSAVQFDGRVEDTFHTTPVMSTYLIAFIVAEYSSIEVKNERGELTFEVISRPNSIIQGTYAIDIGQRLLTAMENFTTIPYYSMNENMKMTQASIPDFRSGAMENWGLLTYREAYILLDKEHTNKLFEQRIVYILSHEIAHMWFGNLVTCHWWADLWLNEGFARFYQYYLSHEIVPEMGFDSRFISEQVHTAMATDSVSNAHPLTDHSMGDAVSIRAHFTIITYNKGAVFLRMIQHMIGENVYEQALVNYLEARKYNVATPEDLFNAFIEAANNNGILTSNVSLSFFYSWTLQSGFPILDVHIDHSTGDIQLKQTRFDRDSGYNTQVAAQWHIPITFSREGAPNFHNTTPIFIMTTQETTINKGAIGEEWVIFNNQVTGMYRVNYDEETWSLIAKALTDDRTVIHEFNRAQIVNDVFALARSGLMTYNRALEILSFLEDESEYICWDAALDGFAWLQRRLAAEPQELNSLHRLIERWSSKVMEEIGYYENGLEPFMKSYLRMKLAPVLCSIGAESCVTAALQMFDEFKLNGSEVPVDSRPWVYCEGLRRGTTSDFYLLWNRFLSHHVYSEKIQLLNVMGCTQEQEALDHFLTYLAEDNYVVRVQDYATTFSEIVVGNEDNKMKVLNWMERNLETFLNARFESIITAVGYISARLSTEEEINQFETFITTNQEAFGSNYQAIMDGAASARNNIRWTESRVEEIREFFSEQAQGGARALLANVMMMIVGLAMLIVYS